LNKTELGAFIVTNIVTIFFVIRWAVNRAIEYTHLERDVKELQKFRLDQEAQNKTVMNDMKGLSMKINKVKESN